MKVIIIGGVAGGMSAATRLRRLDESAEIIVLERSSHVSYANCGLPYFVGGVIEDEETLLLQTPESLRSRFRLDVRIRTEALSIDAGAKTVRVRDLTTDVEYSLDYDKLILSPGGSAVVPALAGIERAFTLRTVEDVERIVVRVEERPRNAVVIGGGFIGVEVTENLAHRGIRTAIVEATPQLLAPLDPEMATLVAEEMQTHGVSLMSRWRGPRASRSARAEVSWSTTSTARATRPFTRLATPPRSTTRSTPARRWSRWPTSPTARVAS
jgi:NADPH-dependent 2,4-dienoyl-CoA reductase/sulfur reductase-like enzyme